MVGAPYPMIHICSIYPELTPANTTGTPQGTMVTDPPLQYGLTLKSSLPCPGEEAPPRPKSLVGVGTWGAASDRAWLLEGVLGLRFPPRPGATKPSRLVSREAVAATKDPGRGHEKAAAAAKGLP
jgi:hypothetical protein